MRFDQSQIVPGNPELPGAALVGTDMNFTLESTAPVGKVFLLLYRKGARKPSQVIRMQEEYQTGRVYSVRIRNFDPDLYEYNYQIDDQVVCDPCAHKLVGREKFGQSMSQEPHRVRCGFLGREPLVWGEKERSFRLSFSEMVLYKLHVRGYTKLVKTVDQKKGTFAGLQTMIPYWKELGVNTIELMPAYEFDEIPQDAKQTDTDMVKVTEKKAAGRINYWGYGSGYYFAPKSAYCASDNPEKEFSELVRSLHESGMACVMEFYFPEEVTPNLVLNILHFWKLHYHVDGFHLLGEGAPVEMALKDAILSDTKIFAPFFDMGRLPSGQVSPERNFAEYNAGFLEDMRRLLKSDEGMVSQVKYRMTRTDARQAVVNFMAYQDGFTLHDMVCYNEKHNEENGEDNLDGSDFNYSWNCGAEGVTRKKGIRQFRLVQLRNAMAMVLLSQEVPMIYGGDEFGNSQKGNNNAYCQDNPIGWIDWSGLKRNASLVSFVKKLITFRREHPVLHMGMQLENRQYQYKGIPLLSFHGEKAWYSNSENSSRMLGIMYAGACVKKADGSSDDTIYIALNFHWEKKEFALPKLDENLVWRKVIDTSEPDTDGFCESSSLTYERTVTVAGRSITVLIGKSMSEDVRTIEEENDPSPDKTLCDDHQA
ncbi:MAG: Type II secretory pathway, pullulanase PulA and related glycosidase [Blautia sp.]|nr:Type II secretory pathway, pullulanase PulA and related glycosidase [Blautia sp.]